MDDQVLLEYQEPKEMPEQQELKAQQVKVERLEEQEVQVTMDCLDLVEQLDLPALQVNYLINLNSFVPVTNG